MTRERDAAPAEAVSRLKTFAERRLAGEPVARILGEREFYGLSFALVPATLVPRPETEMLVDFGIDALGGMEGARVLDLGTGTGCIAIALLANLPSATAVAVDLSAEAAACAAANAKRHEVVDRLDVRVGSWLAPISDGERFDLIVSNPPYVESATIDTLAAEVRDHDPRLALDGGPDGMAPYRIIAADAPRHLNEGGVVAVEIGSTQGPAVTELFKSAGLCNVAVKKDLAGLDRVVVAHQV